MKTAKRLVSVLLTAVLALAMLTACGGGGGAALTTGQQFEKNFMIALNKATDKNLTNDENLKKKAADALTHVQKDGTIAEEYVSVYEDLVFSEDKTQVSQTAIFVFTKESEDGVYTAMEVTPDKVSSLLDAELDSDLGQYMKYLSAVGVATTEIEGKTYAAFAVTVTINASDLPQ